MSSAGGCAAVAHVVVEHHVFSKSVVVLATRAGRADEDVGVEAVEIVTSSHAAVDARYNRE